MTRLARAHSARWLGAVVWPAAAAVGLCALLAAVASAQEPTERIKPIPLYEPAIEQQAPSAQRVAGEVALRGTERLAYRCESELGLRDVTLFGNGTVRLLRRQGDDEPELRLDELTPDELRAYLERLEAARRATELPTETTRGSTPVGSWVETCRVGLGLAGVAPLEYRFTVHEVPPLGVARMIEIADELARFTEPPIPPETLPASYAPRPGDVLRRADGSTARVVKRTDDGEGIELENLEQPTRVFYLLDDLPRIFVAVESRDPDLFGVD
ncbi:MAG: hypothetical protein AAGC60_02690 [Acidobacteriota bacterium]